MRELVCAVLTLVAMGSVAQAAPSRVRGIIAAVAGNDLTVKTRTGGDVTLKLAQNYSVSGVVKASPADIKPDSYVGVTTTPAPNGVLQALEVHIFPASSRGAGEGSRPWDLGPQTMMTNGDVSGSVTNAQGRVLTLSYKGGAKTVLLTPRTSIVAIVSASRADVKPGAGVVALAAQKEADGSYEASRITIGLNGVNPPQ